MKFEEAQDDPEALKRLTLLARICSDLIAIAEAVIENGFSQEVRDGQTRKQELELLLGRLEYLTYVMCGANDVSESEITKLGIRESDSIHHLLEEKHERRDSHKALTLGLSIDFPEKIGC